MLTMDATEARLLAIRDQNQGLLITACELGMPPDSPFFFMCECGDPFCIDSMKLTIAECSTARRERGLLLCPGHGPRRAAQRHRAA